LVCHVLQVWHPLAEPAVRGAAQDVPRRALHVRGAARLLGQGWPVKGFLAPKRPRPPADGRRAVPPLPPAAAARRRSAQRRLPGHHSLRPRLRSGAPGCRVDGAAAAGPQGWRRRQRRKRHDSNHRRVAT
ncbi:unnamed protein product, partial [Phaeothamnion confervicola]